jgi:5-methylcytosine-specific restriction endonuclease McrA
MIEYTKEKYAELLSMGVIEPYSRIQKKVKASHFQYKVVDNKCACGCGVELTGRRTKWASKECSGSLSKAFYIAKGYMSDIRDELRKTQGQKCKLCNNDWVDADHIIPVCKGGGGMGMWNYQGLCKGCHKAKTKVDVSTKHVRLPKKHTMQVGAHKFTAHEVKAVSDVKVNDSHIWFEVQLTTGRTLKVVSDDVECITERLGTRSQVAHKILKDKREQFIIDVVQEFMDSIDKDI